MGGRPVLATVDDWPKYTDVPLPEHAEAKLAAASNKVVAYCGWPIAATTTEAEHDGDGSTILTLDTAHLVAVHEVIVSDRAVTDYQVSRRKAQLRRASRWPVGFGNILVTYEHGYEEVPPDLVELVVGLAARVSAVPVGVVSETVDRLTVRYEKAISLDVFDQAALDSYRLGARP